MTPLWPQPLSYATHPGNYVARASLCESSDHNFYYVCAERGNHDDYYAYKFNADGQSLWSSDGVFVAIISYYNVLELQTYPRNDGGVLINITCDGLYECFFVLQALTSAGEQIAGTHGLNPEDARTSRPKILLLDNDDFILCYITNQTAKMCRYNANLSQMWCHTTASGVTSVPQDLCRINQTSFMYVFLVENFEIKSVRMSIMGEFLSSPCIIITEVGYARNINLTKTSTGEMLLCWSVYSSECMKLMKFDQNGVAMWDQPSIIPTLSCYDRCIAFSDSNGGAYYYLQDWDFRIKVVRVDSEGDAVWKSIAIMVLPDYDNLMHHFAILSGNGLMIVAEAILCGNIFGGIYCQKVSPEGVLTWPDPGYLLMHDATVTTSAQNIIDLAGRALVSFAIKPQNNQARYHYYQIINPDGSLLFTRPGIQFGVSLADARILMCPAAEGNCMILWIEQSSQVLNSLLKAQLIDQQGNQLWEPGGRLLISASGLQSVSCSYQNGYHYIVWTHGNNSGFRRIYGQKYLNGSPQWPEDEKLLSFDHDLYPEGNHQDAIIRGRFLVWFNSASKFYYASYINEDGSIADSYPTQGIQIATMPPYYQTQCYMNAYDWHDNLFVSLTSSYTYSSGGYEFTELTHNAALFSPTAGLLWGQQGYYWNPSMVYCFFDDRFIGIMEDTIICRNPQGHTLWQNELPYNYYYDYTFPRLFKNSENDMTIIAYREQGYEYYDLVHYYVTTEGQLITPQNPDIFNNVHVGVYSATPGIHYSYVFRNPGIVVQKITSFITNVQDPELSPILEFSVSSAYPNPFNNKVSWLLDMKTPASAVIDIYNIKGQRLRSILYDHLEKGQTVINWDGLDSNGQNCASGVYIAKISSSTNSVTKRIIKLK